MSGPLSDPDYWRKRAEHRTRPATPDRSIYLESKPDSPHRWTLWVGGAAYPFEQEFDLYTAIDVATAYLKEKYGITIDWYGPIPPDYSRHYACSRTPTEEHP